MRVRWLGRVAYAEALDLQRALASGSDEDFLLLVEHDPVYTLGRNADPSHVLADPSAVGATLVRTDRGGDVTYHGPGQLVGYPIVSVPPGVQQGPAHVRRVEDLVLAALGRLGFGGAGGFGGTKGFGGDGGDGRPGVGRLDGFPGVWVDPAGHRPRKIAAVGVRASRGRTTHGFALNVHCDLAMFDHIVPCGLSDRPVTSMAAEGSTAGVEEVVDAVMGAAADLWPDRRPDIQRVVAGHGPAVDGDRDTADRPPPATGVPVRLQRRLHRSGVDLGAAVPIRERKPSWLRAPARMGDGFLDLRRELHGQSLVTVCEEAGCPNIFECWADGTATFMINGARCTRACGFCQVDTGRPLALDPGEPRRVADTVARMGLAHAVVTCVARDDLDDGGAAAFAATVAAIREVSPATRVEVLISDLKGDPVALGTVLEAAPDVLNHNIETVARLQRAVRPSAGYARSLTVLARSAAAGLTTKSGLMVGLGETEAEVLSTLTDLRSVGVDIVTIGQYLRPSAAHVPVARWWRPEEFDRLAAVGTAMGFAHVQASPLTRSSYHARHAADAAGAGRAAHAAQAAGAAGSEAAR